MAKKKESIVVAHAADMLDALEAAVVFTDRVHYPGVRVDVDDTNNLMTVSSAVVNQIAAVTLEVEWADLITREDVAFDLSIKQVRDVLQVFKNHRKRPADEDEEQPLIGVHLTAEEITWYDESGIGLKIWMLGQQRQRLDMPSYGARIDDLMTQFIQKDRHKVTTDQLQRIIKACKAVGYEPLFTTLDPGDRDVDEPERHSTGVTAGPLQIISSVTEEPSEIVDQGEEVELAFNDDPSDDVEKRDNPQDTDTSEDTGKTNLRIVKADPNQGLA
ncbi:hypothetical protein [Corynebacterium cystitidis]|uniref:hypothetical protein n=1 Tax=Corynebacterium cystitidis TaxID=35757 RepID=UPI00211E0436|nr:hypothetical protein [Corynebacterium cystitidis]